VNKHGEALHEAIYSPPWWIGAADLVARAIYLEMEGHGFRYVLLDATELERVGKIALPDITNVASAQVLLGRSPSPWFRAHFFCGGVRRTWTGVDLGRGPVRAGEVACTGVHGAIAWPPISSRGDLRPAGGRPPRPGRFPGQELISHPRLVFPVEEETVVPI
jgi:L-aspartate oxidase